MGPELSGQREQLREPGHSGSRDGWGTGAREAYLDFALDLAIWETDALGLGNDVA